jgi:hypothetical protein
MANEDYDRCNKHTKYINGKRLELAKAIMLRPDIGTVEFDKLKADDLLLDLEDRFAGGGVRSLHDYLCLLKKHKNDKARIKVLREQQLFERAMNFCLVEAEANLKHRSLQDILRDYVKEQIDGEEIRAVKKRINNSGHAPMIRALYQ